MHKSLHVADLALRLHRTDTSDLRFALEPGTVVADDRTPTGYVWSDTAIEFQTLAERNRHVAEHTFKQLREHLVLEPDLIYERAYELWRDEIGHVDQASGRLLGMAARELDILTLGSQRIRRGEDVFTVLHLVEATLPFMDAVNKDSLIDFCEAKYERTRNDLAGGSVHGALETWLTVRPEQAIELHTRVLGSLTDASASLLSNSVVAIAKSNFAMAIELANVDAVHTSPLRARIGIWTLGRLLLEEHAPAEKRADVAALVANLIKTKDGEHRVQAVRAACNAMHSNSMFDVLLKRLATDGDQDVLCGVATALFMNTGAMLAKGDIHEWLDLMTGLAPDAKAAIHDLDSAMARLLTQAVNVPVVVTVLTKWVTKHGQRTAIDETVADLFHTTLSKLSRREAEWTAFVTDWLLSDKQEHAVCLAGVLMNLLHRESSPLYLDSQRLDALDPADLLFLARRMLGYVHDRGQVTSMALSMLISRDAKNRIFPVLRALLVDEIGYDYPASTVDACRATAESSTSADVKAFLGHVADNLEQIDKAFRGLPRLNELKPPMKLRRLFTLARHKQMSDAFEEAQKKSVLRVLATEIPIKAGRGTFSYSNASYGNSMQMSSISHSIEMPCREVFDPVGNAIRLWGFRLAKRDET